MERNAIHGFCLAAPFSLAVWALIIWGVMWVLG
jgi:hypothetical protein